FMTFYCAGMMRLRSLDADEDATRKAVSELERSVKLNPRFAPTFEALTQAYGRRPETQGKALEAARKAVELDPESRTYQYGLANLLLNNNRAAEAEEVGKRLLASAATEQDEAAAKRLLATIAEEKAWESESSEDMDDTAASAGGAADKAESNGSAR